MNDVKIIELRKENHMNGWLQVTKKLTGVGLSKVIEFMKNEGFNVSESGRNHAELDRDGTQFTTKGENFPLYLLIIQEEEYTKLYLKYATFALFDTGDLEKLMDKYIEALKKL